MLSRVLSKLFVVRVTVGYPAMLVVVATALVILGPRVEEAVISHMSTNLHNLARGHFATSVGSAFVTSSGFIYVWLPGFYACWRWPNCSGVAGAWFWLSDSGMSGQR